MKKSHLPMVGTHQWLVITLTFLSVLCSCSASVEQSKPVQNPTSGSTPYWTPISAVKDYVKPTQDLYMVVSSVTAPYHYGLIRLTSQCFLTALLCKPEWVPGFPGADYAQAPLQWSSNGQYALFYNSNNRQLFKFTPSDGKFVALSSDLSLIQDEIYWSMDGKLTAAVVQGGDPFSSDIVIVDPVAQTVQKLTAGLDGVAHLLGWRKDNYLVFALNQYGTTSTGSKKVVTKVSLIQMNLQNKKFEDLALNVNWLEKDRLSLSPDGNYLAYINKVPKSPLFTLNLYDFLEIELETPGMTPHWSPDSDWIAGVTTGNSNLNNSYDIFVVHPNGTGSNIITTSTSYPHITWLPNSTHLLVSYPEKPISSFEGSIDLISILENTVKNFSLDLGQSPVILEISWQPTPK